MPGDLDLALRIRADVNNALRGLRRVDTAIDRVGAEARDSARDLRPFNRELQRTEAAAGGLGRSFRGLRGLVGGAIGGYAAIAALRQVQETLDAYTNLNNRLRLVTDSEEELAATRRKLLAISQETRTEIVANAVVYSRLSLAAQNLGRSETELLQVVETLNKQVAIGGSTATEATQGLIQLSQGIASNRLQGDELRSVLESLLGVSDGLITGFARLREEGRISFDVTRENIRELAAEGKLTADLLFDAILASVEETDRKFENVEASIASAGVTLVNSIGQALGKFDEGLGFARGIADATQDIAAGVDDIDDEKLRRFGEELRELFSFLRLGVGGGAVAAFVADLLEKERELREGLVQRRIEGERQARFRRAGFEVAPDLPAQPSTADIQARIDEQRRVVDQILDLERVALERAAELRAEDRRQQLLEAQGHQTQEQADFAAFQDRLNAVRRAKRLENYAQIELERRGLNSQAEADEAAHQDRLDAIDRNKRLEEYARIERERQGHQSQEEADRAAHQDRLNAIDRAALDRARAQEILERQGFNTQGEADEAAHQDQLNAIAREKLEERYAEAILAAQGFRSDEEAREAAHQEQLARIAEAHLRAARDPRSGAFRALRDIEDIATDAGTNIEFALRSGFQAGEDSLLEFVRTGKVEVSSLVDFIIDEFGRIAARQFIIGPLAQALANALGGSGAIQTGLPVGSGSQFAGFAHGGGVAGVRRVSRQVPAFAFLGAPRLHQGGIPGLRPDEIPTVLERGEGVFTPEQMAAMGPAVRQVDVRITNASGQPLQVTESTAQVDGGRLVIGVAVDDLANGGPLDRAIRQRYGLRAQAL